MKILRVRIARGVSVKERRRARAALRILVYLHALHLGGVEHVALRLCKAWAKAGDEVILLLGRHVGPIPPSLAGLRRIVLADGRLPVAAFEDLWMSACLPRIVQKVRPDILFCAGNTYALSAAVARRVMGADCPPIVAKISNDLHRTDLPRWIRKAYHSWCSVQGRMFDRFVAISPAMRAEIEALVRPDGAISVIEDAVLASAGIRLARPLRGTGAGRRFLAVGRLERQKNFAMLLRAFARGGRIDDRLTIVGDGPLRDRLERLAQSLGIAGRVRFAGRQSDMERWYAEADVLLLTSRYEGMPAVVVEALSRAVPVIATDCCASLRAMLSDGRCGILVRNGDIAHFASAVTDFAPCRFDDAAMRSAAAPYATRSAAESYRSLFCDLLSVPRPHGLPEAGHGASDTIPVLPMRGDWNAAGASVATA